MSKSQSSLFIGVARPISEILTSRYIITSEAIKAIKEIPLGHAQETRMSGTSAKALLKRLEAQKLIEPNTYRVRSVGKHGEKKRKYFIVHENASSDQVKESSGKLE